MRDALSILAMDTATEVCSVALSVDGAVTQQLEIAPQGHSKLVLGMAQTLLQQAGLRLDELDALAVDVGPGSFTGLRIGIGVAQGLAYGAGLEVIPVSSLEALAWGVGDEEGDLLPALDARMAQIYCGAYRRISCRRLGGELASLSPPALMAPQAWAWEELDTNPRRLVGVGSGWDRYAPILLEGAKGVVDHLPNRHPEAAAVVGLAAARGRQGAISPLRLSPCYIRDQVATPQTPRAHKS